MGQSASRSYSNPKKYLDDSYGNSVYVPEVAKGKGKARQKDKAAQPPFFQQGTSFQWSQPQIPAQLPAENPNKRLRQEQVYDPNTLGWSNYCQHEGACLGNINLVTIFPAEQNASNFVNKNKSNRAEKLN